MTLILLIVIVNVSITSAVRDEKFQLELIKTDSESNKINFTIVDKCEKNETCVRFCCGNQTACLNEEIFDLSEVNEAKSLSSSYKVLKGRPGCGDMYVEEGPWDFTQVRCWFVLTTLNLHSDAIVSRMGQSFNNK